MKNSHTLLLLAAAACLLASCATDKGYSTLAATAEKNPSKDAITGMWHRKWSDGMGLSHQATVLVRADGTGLESIYVKDWLSGPADHLIPFRWEFSGNGVWTMNYYESNLVYTCSYSQGKLIRYTDDFNSLGPLDRTSNVFERVSP